MYCLKLFPIQYLIENTNVILQKIVYLFQNRLKKEHQFGHRDLWGYRSWIECTHCCLQCWISQGHGVKYLPPEKGTFETCNTFVWRRDDTFRNCVLMTFFSWFLRHSLRLNRSRLWHSSVSNLWMCLPSRWQARKKTRETEIIFLSLSWSSWQENMLAWRNCFTKLMRPSFRL